MSDRPLSVLDGPFAFEWAELGLGNKRVASHRATTSSRTPGKVNRGTVYPRPFAHADLHLCSCGQTQRRCSSCGEWFCQAPGHAQHFCEES